MKPIDLTLLISTNLPSFPGSPKPQFIPWSKLHRDGYNLELLLLSSHSGTHLDAPYHFINNGLKIHQILLKRLICDALLINVKKKANQEITKSDILKFEKKHGKIPKNSTVVFSTGWQKNLQKDNYFNDNDSLEELCDKYIYAVGQGLLKILSKIGISTLQSYQGAQIFEAIGISGEVIDQCFMGTVSRIEGLGYDDLAREKLSAHWVAYQQRA